MKKLWILLAALSASFHLHSMQIDRAILDEQGNPPGYVYLNYTPLVTSYIQNWYNYSTRISYLSHRDEYIGSTFPPTSSPNRLPPPIIWLWSQTDLKKDFEDLAEKYLAQEKLKKHTAQLQNKKSVGKES